MNLTKKEFQNDFKLLFERLYPISYEEGSPRKWFHTLGKLVTSYKADDWKATKKRYEKEKQKQIYYFSMEFLPGRFLKSNLFNMGILDLVSEGLEELGISLSDIADAEPEPGLGNGGLGRLAAAFMDSGASIDIPLHGNGLRYDYGLFKQCFIDNYQVEVEDAWLENGTPWDYRNEKEAVEVAYGGHVWLKENNGRFNPIYENTYNVLAVPYDMQMIGADNKTVNTLRLWKAEVPSRSTHKFNTNQDKADIKEITENLYPDDSTDEGRLLRLKQEYFLVSSGVQSIVNSYLKRNLPIEDFADYVGIHINDTHPAMAIPELIRILLDDLDLEWDEAFKITVNTFSYTNHTVLYEALEKWPVMMLKSLLPRIYEIIEEINDRHTQLIVLKYGEEAASRTAIIQSGEIHMANLSVIGSHNVNGVAALHTEILKNDLLADFYHLYPDRFINQTNGVTQRRWLSVSNPDLAQMITERIGEGWEKELNQLEKLKTFSDDKETLQTLAEVKRKDKEELAAFIKEETGIDVSPDALFDSLIKRLHAYKRQDMQLLHIIDRYLYIKENPEAEVQPRVFIFGAKAAPAYTYAKKVIKVINEVADLINNDKDIGDKMKVIFLENYSVSIAEKIIPATDLSEQISLAGKEASGTGNMKFMMNGALLMGTRDGANVEIIREVGEDNAFVFGMVVEEVNRLKENASYKPLEEYESNPRLKRVLNTLVDGTIPNIQAEGHVIFDTLVHYGDEYFVLKDLPSFIEAQRKADELYQNEEAWYKKSLLNIASSGPFSSDYTVKRYAEQIWDLES